MTDKKECQFEFVEDLKICTLTEVSEAPICNYYGIPSVGRKDDKFVMFLADPVEGPSAVVISEELYHVFVKEFGLLPPKSYIK